MSIWASDYWEVYDVRCDGVVVWVNNRIVYKHSRVAGLYNVGVMQPEPFSRQAATRVANSYEQKSGR